MKLSLLGLLVFCAGSSSAAAENWPGFRGTTRQGLSGETGLPLKWSASENVARNPLHEKVQASIAISGHQLFIRTERHLYCIGGPG